MAGKKQEAKKKERKKPKRNEKRCHCLLYKTNGPSTCFPIWWLRVVYVHQIRLAMVGAKTAAQHQPFLAKCWQSNEMFPRFRHTQAKISSLVLISLRAKWKMRCTLCTCKIAFSKMKLWRKTSKYRMDGWNIFRKDAPCARTHVVSTSLQCITALRILRHKHRFCVCHNRNYRNVDYIQCRIAHWIRYRRTLRTTTSAQFIEHIRENANDRSGSGLWAVLAREKVATNLLQT